MTNSAFPIPTFLNVPNAVNVRTFTSSTTYTPSPNTRLAVIECIGGGGGGGGTATGPGNAWSIGGGGAGGSYSRKVATLAQIGASQTVTIGAAGTGGATGNNAGTAGTTTSVGSLCTAPGGGGGAGGTGVAGNGVAGGTSGGTGTGDVSIPGQPGGNTYVANNGLVQIGGGSSVLGFGAFCNTTSGVTAPGIVGGNYGGGGSGGVSFATSPQPGGNGAPGIVVITEYLDTQSNGISAPVLTLLSSKTFSSASVVEFLIADGLDSTQYTDFYLRFFVKGTADYTLAMQVGTGSPVDYTAAVNRYVNSCADETGTVLTGNSLVASVNLTSSTRTVSGAFAGDGLTGDLNIYNAANGPTPGIPWIQFQGNFVFYSSVTGKFQTNSFANMGGGANSLTGLKFSPNTGTISGRISLYGKKI